MENNDRMGPELIRAAVVYRSKRINATLPDRFPRRAAYVLILWASKASSDLVV